MSKKTITKLLVANRGEIARRIMRTAKDMGIFTVAVYSEADCHGPFATEADEAVCIGPAPAAQSYLDADKIIKAARLTNADAIHPGYGFLAENAGFAKRCEDEGIIFVGPTSKTIREMGSKIESKNIMKDSGVPVIPGYAVQPEDGPEKLKQVAEDIGYPVMIKASAGGGGKGMRMVDGPENLIASVESCARESKKAFSDDALLLEKYFERPRHIEFQVFGDVHGEVVHIFERECSIQRRHQKIIEETPSVIVDSGLRQRMGEAAVAAAKATGYISAGTVEFILDAKGEFYFLEMNTRLQVEHPVTECITGLDLVRWQILVARGEALPLSQKEINACRDNVGGSALECRIYAEDPGRDFLPETGEVLRWEPAPGLARYDSGVENGSVVGTHYDPMLAKIITHGQDREEASAKMVKALSGLVIHGVTTNLDLLINILSDSSYQKGEIDAQFLDRRIADFIEITAKEDVLDAYVTAAAIYQHSLRKQKSKYLPSITTGFRNIRWRDQDASYQMQGGQRTVYYRDIGDGRFIMTAADGEETPAKIIENDGAGRMRIEIKGVQRAFTISSVGDEDAEKLHIHGPCGNLVLDAAPRFPDIEMDDDNIGGHKAPMPGTIVAVMVAEGDRVKKGDSLLIIEAMKMEQTIFADVDGEVKEIFASAGDTVDAGEVLVVLEEDPNAPEDEEK